jgi:hypothetical protein
MQGEAAEGRIVADAARWPVERPVAAAWGCRFEGAEGERERTGLRAKTWEDDGMTYSAELSVVSSKRSMVGRQY